jgi:hypothetical protein
MESSTRELDSRLHFSLIDSSGESTYTIGADYIVFRHSDIPLRFDKIKGTQREAQRDT